MKQKERILKVYRQPSDGKDYPAIMLSGKWLSEMDFAIGDYIKVVCKKKGQIRIYKTSAGGRKQHS